MRRRYKGIGYHNCQLQIKDCWPQLKPRASCCDRIIRAIRNSMLPSYYHPQARHTYKSMREIEKEKLRMVYNCRPYVAHPMSVFAIVCYCTRFFFVYFYIAWSTFELYFHLYRHFGWITIICKVIQSACIVVQFLIGYKVKGANRVEMRIGRIALRYLKIQLIFDMLDLLRPLSQLIQNDLIELWLHLIIFHLYLISRCFFINWWVLKILGIRIRYEQIVWFCTVLFFSLHYLTCMHYGMDYMLPILRRNQEEIQDPHPESLAKAKIYYEHLCIVLVYYMLAFKLVPWDRTTNDHPVIDIIMTIALFFLHVYLVVIIFVSVMDTENSEIKCKYMWNNILNYMNNRNLHGKLRTKIMTYFAYKFQNKFFEESVIIGNLSTHLQYENLLYSCSHLMMNIDLLQGLPKPVVGRIVATLNPLVYLPNDIIMRYSTNFECIYFVSFGTVAMYNSFGKELQHLEDGNLIGSIGYYSGINYMTVAAVSITELYRWDLHDITAIMRTCPELSRRVKRLGKRHMDLVIKSQGMHKNSGRPVVTHYNERTRHRN